MQGPPRILLILVRVLPRATATQKIPFLALINRALEYLTLKFQTLV